LFFEDVKMLQITQPSVQSLLLITRCQGQDLSTAKGFLAETTKGPVLITNWHVASGRRPDNNAIISTTGQVPDEVVIIHNRLNQPGQWILVTEKLLGPDEPLWREHPSLKHRVDIVALPLTNINDVQIYPYSLGVPDLKIRCGPADIVSVVGFPFGVRAGGSLAVWATGFVASEPDIDYENPPVFLIDCRSRPPQSGSPVIAYRSGGMVAMEDGSTAVFSGPVTRFLGIYSGRINEQSDLGKVWKAIAIRQVIDSL
jgi:hypothetical protein